MLRSPSAFTLGALLRGCVISGAALLAGCAREAAAPLQPLVAVLDTTRGVAAASVVIRGMSRAELDGVAANMPDDPRWPGAFSVIVGSDQSVPVPGQYQVTDSAVVFRPLEPFDRGREYQVRVHPRQLANRPDSIIRSSFTLPAPSGVAVTRVVGMLPRGDTLPENQRRIHIEFSTPMSSSDGVQHLRLVDGSGAEVPGAFATMGDPWSADRTRYTAYLAGSAAVPGASTPGRPLVAGGRYSIRVDSAWRDARGQPLVASFVRGFVAGPADATPITLSEWKITAPRSRSMSPVVLRFPESLDHAALSKAIAITDPAGRSLDGDIAIPAGEREWRFTPRKPWMAGRYELVVTDLLEDLGGNRVNKPFRSATGMQPDSARTTRYPLAFMIR